MTVRNRMKQALAVLLPAGVLGISALLATVQSEASAVNRKDGAPIASVAERLSEIRAGVSEVGFTERQGSVADAALLGAWPNFGWGNGGGWGWRNGGWRNGGWGNGGWGNGGWHNWHNGWHNWHNYWNNW
jgi:rSAM-associated Gly-rich repeat protein